MRVTELKERSSAAIVDPLAGGTALEPSSGRLSAMTRAEAVP
jgi:hypothetical protein